MPFELEAAELLELPELLLEEAFSAFSLPTILSMEESST